MYYTDKLVGFILFLCGSKIYCVSFSAQFLSRLILISTK